MAVQSIVEKLTQAAQRSNLIATEADSGQLAELAMLTARVAYEAAAIYRILELHMKLDDPTEVRE